MAWAWFLIILEELRVMGKPWGSGVTSCYLMMYALRQLFIDGESRLDCLMKMQHAMTIAIPGGHAMVARDATVSEDRLKHCTVHQ